MAEWVSEAAAAIDATLCPIVSDFLKEYMQNNDDRIYITRTPIAMQ